MAKDLADFKTRHLNIGAFFGNLLICGAAEGCDEKRVILDHDIANCP